MNKTKVERRIHPRVEKKLPINVAANGYDFVSSTHNISCVGAYCTIDKYVPPFTKVKIKLNLPIVVEGKQQNIDILCNGVIVRTEDNPDGKFNIAIFFNDIKEQPRQKIAQYVQQFLP
ncbi:MAG: PilZ domain-containing protein [Candidatus Omnitrophica bacterium]|nr:PilZ domain-containing protein [Candidatus Omnitrophota bacterium]